MRFLNRAVFLIGWLLSPFTTWNDVLINIPLAYISASLFIKVFHGHFALLVIIFYWLSNALGLGLMYLAGRNEIKQKKLSLHSILVTILVYSIILFLMDKFIVLKPII